MNENSFHGNANLKRKNTEEEYTEEQVLEIIRCKNDPIYFIKNYIHIINLDRGLIKFELYDYQERFIKMLHYDKRIIARLGRQSGKTTCFAAYMCHYIIFNENKTAAILGNKDKTAREILYRVKIMFENLPMWLKPGVVEWNKGTVEFENGSRIVTAATSSSAIRGMSINMLCVPDYTKVCICLEDKIFHTTIEKAKKLEMINNSESEFINIEEKNNMKYYVYQITNLINNKKYVGVHGTDDFDDGYMGSGVLIKRAIEKHGVDNFEKAIIKEFDTIDDAYLFEKYIVNKKFVKSKGTYNLKTGGLGGCSEYSKMMWSSEDFREKMKERATRKPFTVEQKRQHSKLLSGRIFSEEHKNNISESRKRMFENMSEDEYKSFQEKCNTPEKSRKLSEALSGRTHHWQDIINKNPEKIRKTAEAHRGMKRSEETRKKQSELKKGKSPHNKGKVYCYNPETLEKRLCLESQIPNNWKRGYASKCKS